MLRRMKVLLADDHPLVLAALRATLEADDDLEVVAEARSGSQVLPRVRETEPDVVVLDVNMPELDGLGCLERLRAAHPEVRVVMLSGDEAGEHVEAARERGACGFLAKSLPPDELAPALRAAVEADGFSVFGVPEPSADDGNVLGLSEREVAMLRTLARGLSNSAIGRELWITEQTVKFHLTNIYRKLGVENRTQATRVAYEQGLVG